MRFSARIIQAVVLCSLAVVSVSAQSATGGAKGKVKDPRGNGISGVLVTARADGKEVEKAKTDAKGTFEIRGLKPGTYNFVFEKSGYSDGVKYDVAVSAGDVVDLGDRLIMTVDTGTLVLIRGSVFQEDGRSFANAKVEMFRVNADGTVKKLGTASTNYSGDFAFRQPPGSATFRFTASSDGATASKDIEVDSPGIYRLAITLKK